MSSTSGLAVVGSYGRTKARVVAFADCRIRNDLEVELHMSAIITVAVTPLIRIVLRRSARRALCASNIALRTSDRGKT